MPAPDHLGPVREEARNTVRALARDAAKRGLTLAQAIGLFELQLAACHLVEAKGHQGHAAQSLGLDRTNFERRLKGARMTRNANLKEDEE